MGAIPLTATELAAWATGSGVELQPWEFGALQRASRAYCSQRYQPDPYPPWGDPDDLYDDDVIAERLQRGLDKLL